MSAREHEDRNERLFNAIETTLNHLHKKQPQDEIMAQLRERYDSAMYLMESTSGVLRDMGLPCADAELLAAIPAIVRRCHREEFGKNPRFSTAFEMARFLEGLFVGVHTEHFYIVCLDAGGRMIDTVLLQKGGEDSTPFYLEQMLSNALRKDADAIVLCHNHPRGTTWPSDEDVNCTMKAMGALASTGIILLDHIIIAEKQPVSIRECGLVRADLWLRQAMESTLNRGWLARGLMNEE